MFHNLSCWNQEVKFDRYFLRIAVCKNGGVKGSVEINLGITVDPNEP